MDNRSPASRETGRVQEGQVTPRGPAKPGPVGKGEETGTRETPPAKLRMGDPATGAAPKKGPPPQEEDPVAEASEDSFPASDPPQHS